MKIRQTQNGRIVTHDNRPTACVGIPADATSCTDAVRAAVPEGAEVLNVNYTLDFAHVALPANDVTAADRILSEVADCSAVEYAERTPVYEHPFAEKARNADESRFSGAIDASTSVLRSLSDTLRRVRSVVRDGDGDPLSDDQYAPGQVNARQARALLPDDSDYTPTLVVIDTGIDYRHPDLRDRFGENKGRDFGADDDDPRAEFGLVTDHGSHVAGIAAASTDNGEGIEGIAGTPEVRVLSARIFGGSTTTIAPTVAEAIRWAADNGADVVNMSIGGSQFGSETVRRATEYATDNGTLCVAATGNSGGDTVQYPAAHPDVMAVTATGPDGQVADFPDGGERVDVTAPGVGVLSTTPPWRSLLTLGDYYAEKSGTSMASPAAAGVALLGVLAADGEIGPRELRKAIERTADPVPDTPATRQGEGLVQADALVRFIRDRE